MPKLYYRQGENISLDKDFPQVEDVTGIVEIYPSFGGTRKEVMAFTKSNLPIGDVYCENSLCIDGGIPLGEVFWTLFSQMVRDKQDNGRVGRFCKGYMNMGSHQTKECRTTAVHLEVQIKYKGPKAE